MEIKVSLTQQATIFKSSTGQSKEMRTDITLRLPYNNILSKVTSRIDGIGGFPGSAVVGNPPVSAGDAGSSPGPGGSHMLQSNWARALQLLSLCSRAREPQLLSLRARRPCSAVGEATTMRDPCTEGRTGPHLPQLERARAQQQRSNRAKNK